MTNTGYSKQLEDEKNKSASLTKELEQVSGQTMEELHTTCQAEYRFLDKLENDLSKNKVLNEKKIEQIRNDAKALLNKLNKTVDDGSAPKAPKPEFKELAGTAILLKVKEATIVNLQKQIDELKSKKPAVVEKTV